MIYFWENSFTKITKMTVMAVSFNLNMLLALFDCSHYQKWKKNDLTQHRARISWRFTKMSLLILLSGKYWCLATFCVGDITTVNIKTNPQYWTKIKTQFTYPGCQRNCRALYWLLNFLIDYCCEDKVRTELCDKVLNSWISERVL